MPDSIFVFRIHNFSETSKGPLQYIFTGDKDFRQLSEMPLPCFFQQIFCSMAKYFENFPKFQTRVSSNCSCGHVKRNFDILARKFIQEAEIFLFSVQTCWRKKPSLIRKFFSNGSSRQVEPSFVKPTEKNWANGQVFLAKFPNLRTIILFQWKTVSLKCSLGQVDVYFDNPMDKLREKTKIFLHKLSTYWEVFFFTYIKMYGKNWYLSNLEVYMLMVSSNENTPLQLLKRPR